MLYYYYYALQWREFYLVSCFFYFIGLFLLFCYFAVVSLYGVVGFCLFPFFISFICARNVFEVGVKLPRVFRFGFFLLFFTFFFCSLFGSVRLGDLGVRCNRGLGLVIDCLYKAWRDRDRDVRRRIHCAQVLSYFGGKTLCRG